MRPCPICGLTLEDLGLAFDAECGRHVNTFRCKECREEFHNPVTAPPMWRQEIRSAVRRLRAMQAAGEPLPERGVA